MSKTAHTIDIDAPPERVFERLVDHEAMTKWPGISRSVLVREGRPRNGLGAVRRVTAMGVTLEEEVTEFDPPRGYVYRITKGLPVAHRGEVKVVPRGEGCTIDWRVELTSKVPLMAPVVISALGWGLPRALRWFKAEVERG